MPFIEPLYIPDIELGTQNMPFNVTEIFHHYLPCQKDTKRFMSIEEVPALVDCAQ